MEFIKQTSIVMNVVNKGFDHNSIRLPDLNKSGIVYFDNIYEISDEKKEKLESSINSIGRQDQLGFVLVDLYTGQGVSYNGEDIFYSASTIKGPYVTCLNQEIPSSKEKHSSYMIETIKNSDNMKYRALKNAYGSIEFEEWLKEAGCGTINAYKEYTDITPKALTQMWIKMYSYFVSGEENSEWCRDLFVSTKNSFISDMLSDEYVVYSKAGWLYASSYIRSQHDGGIVVKDEHPYVIVVLSNAYGKQDALGEVVQCLDEIHTEMIK